MSSKLRIAGLVALAGVVLLGIGVAFKLPWLPHRGQGVAATVKKWFAPAPQPTVLVAADLDCDWKLDGKPQGNLRAKEIFTLVTTPGQHLVEAKTMDGKDEWRGVVEVHAPEQRVAAIALDAVRQERLVQERLTGQERLANQDAQAAKRIALANQAAIERAAEETRRASRRATLLAGQSDEASKKREEVARREAALRELRAERRTVNAEGMGTSGYSKSVAEKYATDSAKSDLSQHCSAQPDLSDQRIAHATGTTYPFTPTLRWTLADYTTDRTSCDESKTYGWHCTVYLKGSCHLSGLP